MGTVSVKPTKTVAGCAAVIVTVVTAAPLTEIAMFCAA